MTELFGFQAGQRLAAKDQLEQQMAEMSLQQGAQQLKKGAVDIQKSELDVQNAKMTMDRQAEMLKMLSQSESAGESGVVKTTPGEELPDRLDTLAQFSMKAGLPEQGAKYAKDAADIRNNSSLISDREFQQRTKELTFAANVMNTVNDKQSWAEANQLYAVQFGKPSPFEKLEYSPELVGKIRGSVTTQRQQSLIEEAQRKAKNASAQLDEIQTRIQLNKARTNLTVTREQNLKKAGGLVALPKAEDLKAVTDLFVKEFEPGSYLPEEARNLARPVAERMVSLMKQQNLSRSEAAVKAFAEAKDAGDFGGIKANRGKPGTLNKPLAVPTGKDNEEVKGKLKLNMYYNIKTKNYNGPALWTEKGFKPIQPDKTEIGEAEAEADDENEE